MPRPFRAQAQYSRTNSKCHLGQSCSQPAKSWFIYIVGSGGRPRTPPCQGVGDGQLGALAVAPGLDLGQNHHLETPVGRRARSHRPHTYFPPSSQCSPFWGPGAGQELLVTALALVLHQALCCMLDTVFFTEPCQTLRRVAISLMLQVRKLRLEGCMTF